MSDDREWYIYVLKDPRDNEVRYVGWTNNMERRFGEHIRHSRNNNENNYKANWIRSLLNKDVMPTEEIIETGYGSGYQESERKWIEYYRSIGARLTNTTDGGEGMLGWIPSDETRAKLRNINKGRKQSAETIEKRVSKLRGRPQPRDAVEKTRQAHIGSKRSPETIERIRQGKLGKKMSDESRRNMSLNSTWKIGVLRIEDGFIYESIEYAALELNVHRDTLRYSIKIGKPINGYHFTTIKNGVANPIPEYKSIKVTVIRVEDSKIFKSIRDACESTPGSSSSGISHAISNGRTCAGYHWERVDNE